MVEAIIPTANADVETNKQILEFIAKFEGMHECSYGDYKQYSNGYGTKAKYNGECITQEEAEIRARIHIQAIRERYKLWEHSLEVQIAVTSFVYNLGSLRNNQIWLLNNGYYCALGNDFTHYVYAGGKRLQGLVNRRYTERNLICK